MRLSHRLAARRLNDDDLRLLLLHRRHHRRGSLTIVHLARHLALQARKAEAALQATDGRSHAHAQQRLLQDTLMVAREARQERRHHARPVAVTRARLLRDGSEVARCAARRVNAITAIVRASAQGLLHRDRHGDHACSHRARRHPSVVRSNTRPPRAIFIPRNHPPVASRSRRARVTVASRAPG